MSPTAMLCLPLGETGTRLAGDPENKFALTHSANPKS